MKRMMIGLMIPLWVAMLLSSCAHSKEALVKASTALGVVDAAGAPAYELTRVVCSAAQWHVVRGDATVGEKRTHVEEIRAKCQPVYDAFEKLIEYKNLAQSAIDAGAVATDVLMKLAKAQDQLVDAMAQSDALRRELLPSAKEIDP